MKHLQEQRGSKCIVEIAHSLLDLSGLRSQTLSLWKGGTI